MQIKTSELFECEVPYLRALFEECEYPWQLLPKIKEHVRVLIENGIEGFTSLEDGILVGRDVKIDKGARILPPAIIGHGCEIRQGAFIRGNVILGSGCVVGNSSELKNCILLDRAQVPHYNYVGDSVLGNGAHLGAGAICSNLKSDKSLVVIRADKRYETGLKKLGAILGDGVEVGCGCVLNPGTLIGKATSVYPLTSLRGVYDEGCIIKSSNNIVKRN